MAHRRNRFSPHRMALGLTLTLTLPLHSQSLNRSPLSGIRNLTVAIETLSNDAQQAGLTSERLRTISELKLRLAGLRVLTDDENRAHPALNPYLYVNLNLMAVSEASQFLYSVDVSLRVGVQSPLNQAFVVAVLWNSAGIARAGKGRMPDSAERYLQEFLDEFVNAYLAANPRQ